MRRAVRSFFLLAIALASLGGCASSSKEAEAFVQSAQTVETRGDDALAAQFYRRALTVDPDQRAALAGLADLQERRGQKEEAAATLKRLVALTPEDAALQRRLGKLLLTLERPMEARAAFEAALAHDPENAKLMGELAVALDCISEHAAAQKRYAEALKRDPENLVLVNNLAYSHILDEDYKGAIALLEPWVKDKRARKQLRQNLSLAYAMAGMMTDAQRIARMDLSSAETQAAMHEYRRQRAEKMVATSAFVELGSYPTQDMATAVAEKLRPRILAASNDMKPVIAPELTASGGTPRFSLRLMSCAEPAALQRFCADLVKDGIPCKPSAAAE
jgi:Flp pilus assembly protein TadD